MIIASTSDATLFAMAKSSSGFLPKNAAILQRVASPGRGPKPVLSQSSIFGQNSKIVCQEFNDLQTPKLSKKQLCDRTRERSEAFYTDGMKHRTNALRACWSLHCLSFWVRIRLMWLVSVFVDVPLLSP